MSESIKTGGVGKNPAIEKMNRLNEITNRMQAAKEIEKNAFESEKSRAEGEMRKRIVEEFQIGF